MGMTGRQDAQGSNRATPARRAIPGLLKIAGNMNQERFEFDPKLIQVGRPREGSHSQRDPIGHPQIRD